MRKRNAQRFLPGFKITRGATIARVGAHISTSASLDPKLHSVRYQTFRSASDVHVFVLCFTRIFNSSGSS